MIVPELTELRPDHLQDLWFLFKLCDQEHDDGAMYNPETSLVAFHNGQMVGFVTAWIDSQPYAFIDNLLVHPDFRHKGIGFWLCVAMKDILFKRGVRLIRAIVTDGDVVFRGLVKYGFQKVKGAVVMEIFNNEKFKA